MKRLIKDFGTAVLFLTILPAPRPAQHDHRALASSMIFFPLVGFLIAAVSLGLVTAVTPFFPERFSTLLLVLIPILLTGALHVDGFADFFDAFFFGRSREHMLQIMKDSRIGVWGAVSIVFLVLMKWELLLLVPMRGKTFLAALALARWSQVLLSWFQPAAREGEGLGSQVAKRVGARELIGSSVFALAACALLNVQGFALALAVVAFVLISGVIYKKKFGGITGDLIGATSEMTELTVFLWAAAFTWT